MDETEKRVLELDVVYTGGNAVDAAIADLRRYAAEWDRIQGIVGRGMSPGRFSSSGSPPAAAGMAASASSGGASAQRSGSRSVDDEAAGRARMHASAMRWAKIEYDEQKRQDREREREQKDRERRESAGRKQYYADEQRDFARAESAKERETRQRTAAESRGRAQFYAQEQRDFARAESAKERETRQREARESAGRKQYYAEEDREHRRQVAEELRDAQRVRQAQAQRSAAISGGMSGVVGGGQQMAAGASRMISAATGFISFLERSASMALSVAGTIENAIVGALQHVERAALVAGASVAALGAVTIHTGLAFNQLKENTLLTLETLTKSGEKAQKVFDFAFKLSIPAKFTFDEVLTGAKTLESFGLKLDNYGQQTGRYLRAAVALAQGMGKPLEQATRYLGAVSQGRALLQQSAALGLGRNVMEKYGVEYDSRNSPKDRKALLEATTRAIEDIWSGFIERMENTYESKLDSMISFTRVFAGRISEGLFSNLKPAFGKVSDMIQNLLDPAVGTGKDRISAASIKKRIEAMRDDIVDMRSQRSQTNDPKEKQSISASIKEEEGNLSALNKQYVALVRQLGPMYALVEGLSIPFTLLGKAINGAADHIPQFVNWLGQIITKQNVVEVISQVVTLIRIMGKDVYDFLQRASGGQGLAGIWVNFRDAAKGAIDWVVVRFEAFLAVLDYLTRNGDSVWKGFQDGANKVVEIIEALVGLQIDNFFLKMASGATTIGLGFATAAASIMRVMGALGMVAPAAAEAAVAAVAPAAASAQAASAAAAGAAAGAAATVGAAGVAGGVAVATEAGNAWDAMHGKSFVPASDAAGEMGLNPLYHPESDAAAKASRMHRMHADLQPGYHPHDTLGTVDDIRSKTRTEQGIFGPVHMSGEDYRNPFSRDFWTKGIPKWWAGRPKFLGGGSDLEHATPDQMKALRGTGADLPGAAGGAGAAEQFARGALGASAPKPKSLADSAFNQARDAGRDFLGWGASSVHGAVPKDSSGRNMADEASRIWRERVSAGDSAASSDRARVAQELARSRAQVSGMLTPDEPEKKKTDPDIAPSVFIAAHGLYSPTGAGSDRNPAVLDKILEARKYRASSNGKEEGPEDLLGSIPLLRERQRGERKEVVKAIEERDRRGEAGSEHAGELIDQRGEVKSAEESEKDQERYWAAVGKFWKTESQIYKVSHDAMEMRANTVIETSKAYEASARAQLSLLSKSEQQVAGEQTLIPAIQQRQQAILSKMQQVGRWTLEGQKLETEYWQEEKGIQDIRQHATDEREKQAFTLPKKRFETINRLIKHMPKGQQRAAIQQMLMPRIQGLMAGANAETDPDKREEKQLEVMDLIAELQGEMKARDPFHGAFDREQAQERHGAMQRSRTMQRGPLQRGQRGRNGRILPQGNQSHVYRDMSPFGIAQSMGAMPGISLRDMDYLTGAGGGGGGFGASPAAPTYNQMVFNFPPNATPDQMKAMVNQQIENLYRQTYGQGARR